MRLLADDFPTTLDVAGQDSLAPQGQLDRLCRTAKRGRHSHPQARGGGSRAEGAGKAHGWIRSSFPCPPPLLPGPQLTTQRYEQEAFLPPLLSQLEAHQSLAASHLLSTTSVTLLSALLAFHTTTSTLASSTTSGSLPSAVDALRAVTSAVEEGAEDWIEETSVWRALVKWAGEEETRLELALQSALEACWEISPASPTTSGVASLTLRKSVAAAPGGEQLDVLTLLGGLKEFASVTGRKVRTNEVLQRLAKGVVRHFVAPFLEANGKPEGQKRLTFTLEEQEGARVVSLGPAGAEDEQDAIASLSSFLAFFSEHSSLLTPSTPPSEYAITLTAHLTPPLQSHLISSHLVPSIPLSTSSLTSYLALLSTASTFESTFLPQHGYFSFLPPSSRETEEQRVIRSWATRVPNHWAKTVGDSALSRIRTAVKGWDWGEGETVEVEVKEEEEMLGLLLGLGLGGEEEGEMEGTATPGGTRPAGEPRRAGQLALETVPKGAKRQMTVEEALKPKPPRARSPSPPPPPPPPAPAAPVEPEALPTPSTTTSGPLKRGKLGAARIASPLPPRSPSPPPLFQGNDAPLAHSTNAASPATPAAPLMDSSPSGPVSTPPQPPPSPPYLPRSAARHSIEPPAGSSSTPQPFDHLEPPAQEAGGIETTADYAPEEEVSRLEGEEGEGGAKAEGHAYEATVDEEKGRESSPEEERRGRVQVEVKEETPASASESLAVEEEPVRNEQEENAQDRVIKEESVEPSAAPLTPSLDREIKEESVEPSFPAPPSLSHIGAEAPFTAPAADEEPKPAENDVAPYEPYSYEPASYQPPAPVEVEEASEEEDPYGDEVKHVEQEQQEEQQVWQPEEVQPYEAEPYEPVPYEPTPYEPSPYEPSPYEPETTDVSVTPEEVETEEQPYEPEQSQHHYQVRFPFLSLSSIGPTNLLSSHSRKTPSPPQPTITPSSPPPMTPLPSPPPRSRTTSQTRTKGMISTRMRMSRPCRRRRRIRMRMSRRLWNTLIRRRSRRTSRRATNRSRFSRSCSSSTRYVSPSSPFHTKPR